MSSLRLATFSAAAVLAWFSLQELLLSPVWMLIPGVAFVVLVAWHDRVRRAWRRASREETFYRSGLDRLEDRWPGRGASGARFLDEDHPYAADLDLFGEGSLFELLCTARTRGGEETLARWLLEPASAAVVRERQGALRDLRDRLDLREDLAVLGEDVRARVDAPVLAAWARRAGRPGLGRARAWLLAITAVQVLALASWGIGVGPAWPVGIMLLAGGVAWFGLRRRVRESMEAIGDRGADLVLLTQVLGRFERETFHAPGLQGLRRRLATCGLPPSHRIARLGQLLNLHDARGVPLIGAALDLGLWSAHFALAIEAWRERFGEALRGWIDAVAEIEALLSLASHAYEHPQDPLPELLEDGAVLEGEGIGHPLLGESRCVRNDVRLGEGAGLLVVSGSNMSGKSTLLRAVGCNVVLALSGAPVRAARLRLSPLAVGASIRTLDSMRAGRSRFYAEILRLRRLVDLTEGRRPLLFLLDEILGGTNSHDRRIGAEALLRGFLARGAIGLVTTHDLALTRIAAALAPRAANVHFSDELEGGRLVFDYRLHPGVVSKSNALDLMRGIGLDV